MDPGAGARAALASQYYGCARMYSLDDDDDYSVREKPLNGKFGSPPPEKTNGYGTAPNLGSEHCI